MKDKMMICPKAKECKSEIGCNHYPEHKYKETCRIPDRVANCPACIDYEPQSWCNTCHKRVGCKGNTGQVISCPDYEPQPDNTERLVKKIARERKEELRILGEELGTSTYKFEGLPQPATCPDCGHPAHEGKCQFKNSIGHCECNNFADLQQGIRAMSWANESFKFRRRIPDKEQSAIWNVVWNVATSIELPLDMQEPILITHIDGITKCKSAKTFNDGERLWLRISEPVYVYYNKAEKDDD